MKISRLTKRNRVFFWRIALCNFPHVRRAQYWVVAYLSGFISPFSVQKTDVFFLDTPSIPQQGCVSKVILMYAILCSSASRKAGSQWCDSDNARQLVLSPMLSNSPKLRDRIFPYLLISTSRSRQQSTMLINEKLPGEEFCDDVGYLIVDVKAWIVYKNRDYLQNRPFTIQMKGSS